jgi:branched-chain amino acid transport system permease protein
MERMGVNFTELVQAIVNGIVDGSLWGMLAIGFGLILGVSGRFHFAYATTFVVAIYATAHLYDGGLPLFVAIVLGIAAAVILGALIEAYLYRPLVTAAGATALLAVFVTSLGIVVIGENVIQLIWGAAPLTLPTGYTVTRESLGGQVGVPNLGLVIVGTGAILTICLWSFIRYAQYGRAIRAVRENPDMATAIGIQPERVYLFVFAVGSALSGIAAILLTQQTSGAPDAGVEPTFTALVAVFLAGLRSSPLRFMLAGVFIGLLQNVVAIWINGLWSPVVTFGLLFVYLAFVPYLAAHPVRIRLTRPRAGPLSHNLKA